jgi:manganese/zinc/iron transport system permease protein
VGALVGMAASLLGVFLVLRRTSMLTDAISHSILLGIVLVFFITGDAHSPFYVLGAASAGVLTVFLTELLYKSGRVKEDAAIGLVFPALFALAVLLINLFARNVHIDVHAVLLGEIAFAWLDTTTFMGLEVPRSLLTMGVITLVNALFVVFFYKELKLVSFDPGLALALGFSPTALHYALLTLTSITAVGAFDAVGAILFIAFVIVPPAAAYLLTDRLAMMILLSMVIAILSSLTGYALAVAWDVSIGGMMATMTGVFLALSFILSPKYGLLVQESQRRRQRARSAQRLLLVHLYNHEGDKSEGREESERGALQSHLRWSKEKVEAVLRESLRGGFIVQEGSRLELTERGRAEARALLEPWTAPH